MRDIRGEQSKKEKKKKKEIGGTHTLIARTMRCRTRLTLREVIVARITRAL